MKNKFLLFIILTIVLFVLSFGCFKIMQINAEVVPVQHENSNIILNNNFYYFSIVFGLIGLVLYNIVKITYDKMFNNLAKLCIEKNKRVLIWILYVLFSIIFWIFVFINSNIGGGLTDLYQFKSKTLHGLYIIDILFILPLWNILYNAFKSIRRKVSSKKSK